MNRNWSKLLKTNHRSYGLNAIKKRRFREMVEQRYGHEEQLSDSLLKLTQSAAKLHELAPDEPQHARDVMHYAFLYTGWSEAQLDPFDREKLDDDGFEEYYDLKRYALETNNMYFVVEVFVWAVQRGLTPPGWAIVALAEKLSDHLSDPDPKKLAKQLRLQSDGSGKSTPYDSFRREIKQRSLKVEMLSILASYDIPKLAAAKAALLKHGVKMEPKSLVNSFNDDEAIAGSIDNLEPISDEATRNNFYRSFPADAKKLLRNPRI